MRKVLRMPRSDGDRDIYRHADRELAKMLRFMAAAFQNQSVRAAWDQLNVISISTEVNRLYREIDLRLRRGYLEIGRRAYRDAWADVVGHEEEPEYDLDEPYVAMLLDRFDPKTEYQYSREWDRKRDRLKESMMAVGQATDRLHIANTQAARKALKRALHVLEDQVREMVDTVTDEARNEAFEDAGIERVRWNTHGDERVCQICRERDQRVYRIDRLPTKHRRCRCWYSPA